MPFTYTIDLEFTMVYNEFKYIFYTYRKREGNASFSKSYVKQDKYTAWVFIDINDTAARDGTSLPDPEDYVIPSGRDINMDSDQTGVCQDSCRL